MAQDGTAPDITPGDSYLGLDQCSEMTADKIDEYAATLKFIKLLAGYGPEQDVADARQAVVDAVNMARETADYVQEAIDAQQRTKDRLMQIALDMGADESQAWRISDQPYHPGISSGDWAINGRPLIDNPDFVAAREANRQAYERLIEAQSQQASEEWEAWRQGWIDWWNELVDRIANSTVMTAICAVMVEGAFLIAEEAVTWGLAAIAGMVTGGIGAVAVKIVARATISGSRTARISVRAVRVRGSEAMTRQALGEANDVPYPRIVDANDLEGVERQILDEDFYGGHQSAPDIDGDLTPIDETPNTSNVTGDGGADPPPQTSGATLSDAEWAPLRAATPSREVRSEVQGRYPPASPDNPVDDPWLPGMQRTGTIEADHIVPAARIRTMDGFADLTEEHQLEVLNFQDNFHGLSRSANASRGELSFRDWTTYQRRNIEVNPILREQMILEEERLEEVLQGMIYDRLREQNASPGVPFREN